MKRHQPTNDVRVPFTQVCKQCGASRMTWGGKPYSSWVLDSKLTPYCSPKEAPNA